MSLVAKLHASSDVREPISLHQTVLRMDRRLSMVSDRSDCRSWTTSAHFDLRTGSAQLQAVKLLVVEHLAIFHILLHRLVTSTCRPFSVKLSPCGTGCLRLPSLLRLSLLFALRFDATLSWICSSMVSLSSLLSFFS